MNSIINKFSLVLGKVMPKMHLKQQGFRYNVCEQFSNKRKE